MLLGVDVGGTFTDAVLLDGAVVETAKAPTTPEDQSIGVMRAVDAVLEQAAADPSSVTHFAHGMTVGTNALLERRGARTSLIATRGFTDLLEVARQNRPSLYRINDDRPAPLAPTGLRVEVQERMGPDGVIEGLTDAETNRVVAEVGHLDPEAVAICLLFSFLDPDHEGRIATALREHYPDLHVSVSSEVLPQFREYERCATTVLDAYLSPPLERYLTRLQERCRRSGLPEPLVMRSSGGLVSSADAASGGAWSVLSGPAGGAVGAGALALASGDGNALGLDMGGTSCDVCVIEGGQVGRTDSREFDGRPIQLPMVDIHTVGAGGGSIAWCDGGGALRIGPESAGADPGPACYGRGGTVPTVTDANLMLGFLDPASPLAGGVALDRDAAASAIANLGEQVGLGPIATAHGVLEVANQEMVRALRVVTVERGIDPRGFALLPFGGAGPLHAAAIAEELGIDRILCPRFGGVLSAFGLIQSERRRDTTRTVMLSAADLSTERLGDEVEFTVAAMDPGEQSRIEVVYELRYRGQSFELPIPGARAPDPAELIEDFAAEHERRYGYRGVTADVELVNVRVASVVSLVDVNIPDGPREPMRRATRPARLDGSWAQIDVFTGEPAVGMLTAGPCIFELPETTLLVPAGWSVRVDDRGTVVLTAERRR